MSAGGGVRHSEYAVGGPAHYVQMWVRPATFGEPPAYDTVPVGPGLAEVTPLRQPDATLTAGRLAAGGTATLGAANGTCTCSSSPARPRSGRPGSGRGTRCG